MVEVAGSTAGRGEREGGVAHVAGIAEAEDRVRRLVESFLGGRSERTAKAYRQDLKSLCAHLDVETMEEAARVLLDHGHGPANGLALDYRNHLVERGLAPATINRRLAAVRSLVALARTLGLVTWKLEVRGVRSQSYRDTRGPGRAGFLRLVEQVSSRRDTKGLRDLAIVRMLHDVALRREEVVSLDVEHVDVERGLVAVLGKGDAERVVLTLPSPTREAIKDWLGVRGPHAGPLFSNLDRAGKGQRLTGRSVHRLVRKLGAEIGVAVRPHGLRHAAITEALDLTGGDVRKVQRFSRHRDVRVLARYDDSRQDFAGEVARLVAGVAPRGADPDSK